MSDVSAMLGLVDSLTAFVWINGLAVPAVSGGNPLAQRRMIRRMRTFWNNWHILFDVSNVARMKMREVHVPHSYLYDIS